MYGIVEISVYVPIYLNLMTQNLVKASELFLSVSKHVQCVNCD